LEEQRTDEVASERGEKRFLKYTFFRVVREWRFQSPEQKAKMKDEFLSVLDEHARRVGLQFFSLVGLRGTRTSWSLPTPATSRSSSGWSPS